MSKEFIYKRLDYPRDGKQFAEAWVKAFDRKVESRLLEWVFGHGSGNRIYVAVCKESSAIAGGYCLLKQEALVNNEVCASYLCNNVFTVPEYRIYNVFVRLGRFALEENRGKQNIALGFPNSLALPGHKRVGWSVCEPIAFYERNPFAGAARDNYSFQDISENDLPGIEALWRKNGINSSFCIVKNAAYFKWRYIDRPKIGRKYILKCLYLDNELMGYMVLSHYFALNKVHIVDIMAETSEVISCFLQKACELASTIGAKAINVWGSPILISAISELGFAPVDGSSRLIVKSLAEVESGRLVDSMRSHHLVLGDNDVF